MNVFDYIERFKSTHTTQTYGDLMQGHKGSIASVLDNNEKSVYDSMKNADRMRLIKEGRSPQKESKGVRQKPVFVSGVGQIMQVC